MRTKWNLSWGWLAAGLLLFPGCVSTPQPQPVPAPDLGLLRQSTPVKDVAEILLVGLPGAVAGAGRVEVRDTISGEGVAVASTTGGSFALRLPAPGDPATLELRFTNDDGTSEAVRLGAPGVGSSPLLEPPSRDRQTLVSLPNATGQVVVSNVGSGGAAFLRASPNATVIAANTTSGAVAISSTDAEGRFTLTLVATSGDAIEVMLVDATDPGLTSDFLGEVVR